MNPEWILSNFAPDCEQEKQDRRRMLELLGEGRDLLHRGNESAHFTASSWIVSPDRRQVLMVYHNIYQSWSWTGGHADGESDFLRVALREAQEETSISRVRPLSEAPLSLEILPVAPHFKRGRFVCAHVHLNVTYLLEADPALPLRVKPDENSGVRWFAAEEVLGAVSEPCMRVVYQKLMEKTADFS